MTKKRFSKIKVKNSQMKISEDTQYVIQFVQEACEGRLRKANDLASILEMGASFGTVEETAELIFAGASLWNISKKIKKMTGQMPGSERLAAEYIKGIEELASQLKSFASYAPPDVKKRFTEIYLQADRGSALNIIDLAHDLAELKNVQNTLKRT